MVLFFSCSFPLAAQMSAPCVTQKVQLDLSCSCVSTNSCYQAMSKNDKKVYKYKTKTKTDKKLYKLAKEAYDIETKLFSRQIKPSDKAFIDLEKKNQKLDKVVAKRLKWYENFLKSKGAKKWRMKDRVEAMNRKYMKSIPKETIARLNQEGIFGKMNSMLASKLTGKAYGDYVPSSTIRISASGKIIGNTIEELKTDSKEVANNENPLKRNTNDLENRANAMKRKNFKFDTIIKMKEASLFVIISTRYKAVISRNRVTIPIQRETISKEQRQRILGSFQELIKKL